MDMDRCFEILEISPEASLEEIKRVYRDMVAVWHPDRFSNNPRLQSKAEKKLQEVNLAYNFLLSQSHDPSSPQFRQPSRDCMQIADKRQFSRNSCQLIVDYKIQGRAYSVYYDYIQDISAGGVFIQTNDKSLTVGQNMQMTFSLPFLGKLMDIACVIVRCTEDGIGIKFKISPKYQKLLSSFIKPDFL